MHHLRLRTLLFGLVVLTIGCGTAPASTPAAPATSSAPEPVLPHQTFTVDSKLMGETRRINVYTPPDYDKAPDARYPVIYMPDGGVEEDFPHVTTDIDAASDRVDAGTGPGQLLNVDGLLGA